MARSYLFPGSDTEHLSPYQRQLERLYDQTDRPGNRVTPQQFFKSPEFGQFVTQTFGGIPVPPGANVISQTPFEVVYRDAEGYEHKLTRDVSGGKEGGQVTEQTTRPAILPNQGQQQFTTGLQERVQQGLTPQSLGLQQLDPETAAALQAISDAEIARNAQQGQQDEARLVAGLYGNRVNQSSIANSAAAQFAQLRGLVNQQQQSDAANRSLALRQLLTTLNQQQGQQQTQTAAGLLGELSSQANTREIASAGLGMDAKKLEELMRQFNASNAVEGLKVQTQQEQLDAANSPFQKFIQTVNAAAGVAGGVGSGISAYGALTKK